MPFCPSSHFVGDWSRSQPRRAWIRWQRSLLVTVHALPASSAPSTPSALSHAQRAHWRMILFPSFSLSPLRPDNSSKEHPSHFCARLLPSRCASRGKFPRDAQRDGSKRAMKISCSRQRKGRGMCCIDVHQYKEVSSEKGFGERKKPAVVICAYATARRANP